MLIIKKFSKTYKGGWDTGRNGACYYQPVDLKK